MLKIGSAVPCTPRKPEILEPRISDAGLSTGRTKCRSTRYSTGVGPRRRRWKGALTGGESDTKGTLQTGSKAWTLPLRPGSRRLRGPSTTAGGHASISLESTQESEPLPIRMSRLLTIKDLAEQLRIKPSTLYSWAAQGKIPSRKIHGLIRFVPLEIDRWLASFAPPPSTPLLIMTPRPDHTDLEHLIARAKRAVYTAGHGETITPSPTGKE